MSKATLAGGAHFCGASTPPAAKEDPLLFEVGPRSKELSIRQRPNPLQRNWSRDKEVGLLLLFLRVALAFAFAPMPDAEVEPGIAPGPVFTPVLAPVPG